MFYRLAVFVDSLGELSNDGFLISADHSAAGIYQRSQEAQVARDKMRDGPKNELFNYSVLDLK